MHNPAAAHPRLLALIEGMEKHHEARFQLDTLARCWDAEEEAWYDFAVAALPPLLAFLRERAEADFEVLDTSGQWHCSDCGTFSGNSNLAFDDDGCEYNQCPDCHSGIEMDYREIEEWEEEALIIAHHACCTTALAAAAGTPALAVLAGELQKEMG